MKKRIVIMGAAGRDFHNFNMVYRDNPDVEVVAFTAAQIAGISGRTYPPSLAGPHYPQGIPIVDESELETLCSEHNVNQVIFAYSDLPHVEVMHRASRTLACGADFVLLGPDRTMLQSRLPVIAVSAVRTGCGKSQTARWLSRLLRDKGLHVAILRHPMPYGDLQRESVQRFATCADLDTANCTLEEREEYEPHLAAGNIVYAGVDYRRILELAEQEADIILWDGGNNDFPFLCPNLHIVLVDALRPGHESAYHPGETVLRMADIVVIAKSDCAAAETVAGLKVAVRRINPRAEVVLAASPITLDQAVAGKRALVVEDGPTTTHGGMSFGAGLAAATRAGAAIVDPRPYAVGAIAAAYLRHPHLGDVLPALGYTSEQLAELQATINHAEADVIVSASPIDLAALLTLNKPVVRARYQFAEASSPGLGSLVGSFLNAYGQVGDSANMTTTAPKKNH
jgi:predicted GTPase